MPNSLACSDKSIVKNLRTESLSQGQKAGRAVRTAYAFGLWQLHHHLLPEGQLRLRGSFLQMICSEVRQRAEAWKYNKMIKKHIHIRTLKKASTATNITVR